jgi:transcriptional regulator with XRE-family HTH domain
MLDAVPETEPMTIADRIKELRKKHGLNQEDLADKAGLGVATIQRAEGGKAPSADTIKSIAAAFNMSPEMLTSASKPKTSDFASNSYLPLVAITSGK